MDGSHTRKVIAVDWGAKRIGLAISDSTQTLARPLTIIEHKSRKENAKRIIEIANEMGADIVIIGVTYSDGNQLSPSGRSAFRLAKEVEAYSNLRVFLWDEEFTTVEAKTAHILSGKSREKKRKHYDDTAATVLLQDYLDRNKNAS